MVQITKQRRVDIGQEIIAGYRIRCTCAADGRAFCSDRPTTPAVSALGEHNAPDWVHELVRPLARALPVANTGDPGDDLRRKIQVVLEWCRNGDREERSGALQTLLRLSKTKSVGARAVFEHIARNQ